MGTSRIAPPAGGWTTAAAEEALAAVLVGPEGARVRASQSGNIICIASPHEDSPYSIERQASELAAALEASFFDSPLAAPVLLCVAGDAAAYTAAARAVTGSDPWSPSGFSVSDSRVLVVNAESGGLGTACHELVHLLVHDDWAAHAAAKWKPREGGGTSGEVGGCPIWLNEGLASLYEWPVKLGPGNWAGGEEHRLVQLRDRGPIALADLFHASTPSATAADFGGPDAARYQATARLFCVYLQHKGLLRPVYRVIRDSAAPLALPSPNSAAAATEALRDVTEEGLDVIERDFRNFLDELSARSGGG